MRWSLSPEETRWVEVVRAFVADHWRSAGAQVGYAAQIANAMPAGWASALTARGWTVPAWPAAAGGCGWTWNEHLLFERTLAEAGALSPANLATTFVGPLLLAAGSEAQQARWLPGIRDLSEGWCVAVADASPPLLEGGRLSADKAWVAGATSARWMLAWADGWWCVDLTDTAVTVEQVPMLGDTLDVCRVRVDAAALGEAALIRGCGADWQPPPHPVRFVRSARLHASLARLDHFVQERDGSLAADADFQRERNELGVALEGLEATERRAAQMQAAGEDASGLLAVAALRGVATGQQLSDLAARAMGYYALPYADELLLSNEGAIGDELALPAVKAQLFDRAWSLHVSAGAGDTAEQLKNKVALEVLGLPMQDHD